MKHFVVLLLMYLSLLVGSAQAQCPPGNLVSLNASVTNASCHSGSDGTITLSITNGTAPFSYLWSNGSADAQLNNLTAGTYSVTVTDALGCQGSLSGLTVTQPGAFIYNVILQNVTCFGGSNGSLNFSLIGGTPPYTYLWTNPVTGDTLGASNLITGLSAGIYRMSVEDAKGCRGGIFYLIAEPPAININDVVNDVTCPGGSDGSVILTVTGGTGTKTYLWSTGSNAKDLLDQPAGNYTVTVTDVNSCTATRAFTINEPDSIQATADIEEVLCSGLNEGEINLTVTGGTPPYAFIWNNGATTQNLTGLTAGEYCVTITDALGCESEEFCFEIIDAPPLELSADITPLSCEFAFDGAIDLTISGGTAPFTIIWSNGATTEDLSNLPEGLYSVLVEDANGCRASATYSILPLSRIIISLGIVNAHCGAADGAIFAYASGGTSPYSFAWSNGGSTASLTGLVADYYDVTVTDDNGCTQTATAILHNISDITIQANVTNTTCGGGNTGAIDLTVAGGTAPYTYAWSNGATTPNISGLTAGTYRVTVTDADGCSAFLEISVEEESGIVISISTTPSECIGFTGTATASAAGGTAPYSFNWSTGETTNTISNLPQGTYQITVTDANGCSSTAIATVNDADAPSVTIFAVNETCGGGNGSINVIPFGGTPPYTYAWSNGANTATISGLTSGTFIVTVTDANGCAVSAEVELELPEGLIVEADREEPSCNGFDDGAIFLTVTQGLAPFSFVWSTGDTTQNLTGIEAGTYTVAVLDRNGCAVIMTIVLEEPDEITITATDITPPTCEGAANGELTVTVSGGEAPYTILWSTGDTTFTLTGLTAGEYCAVATDASGCVSDTFCFTVPDAPPIEISAAITNVTCLDGSDGAIDITVSGGTAPFIFYWSNGATTEDISNLAPGFYTVYVTDSSGCEANATYTIAIENVLVLSVGITQPDCGESNGSATVSVSGGTAPFTFAWSNGGNTETIDGISAGVYTVTVTDANGCSAVINADVSNISDIEISATNIVNTVCGGGNTGAIDITVTGGTAPYTFEWSNGETTQNISGLAAGIYFVIVTDADSCIAVRSFEILEESGLTLTFNNTNGTCGEADGSAEVNVAGGTGPFTYLWSNGQTTAQAIGLSAGLYTVTVTDANGCEETGVTFINDAGGPQFTLTKTDISCVNDFGTAQINNVSGTAPFSYLWSTGATTSGVTGLSAGVYSVTVEDANECISISTIEILTPEGIIVEAEKDNPACEGDEGAINVTVSGGLPPYTYTWSTGASSPNLTGLSEGTYIVTVTDANGCSATTTIELEEFEEIIAVADSIIQPTCNGESDGAINITVTGGTAPFTFEWSNGATTQNISGLTADEYCVVITDANGCVSDTFCFTVNEPDEVQLSPDITQPLCNGDDNGSITVTATGGTAPYTFAWDTGDSTNSLTGLLAGNYSVTATDANGCTATADYEVTEPDTLTISSVQENDVQCSGADDGSITVQVSGGTTPFTFNWSNNSNTQNLTGLEPGTYQLTVTDANGCSDTSSAIVIEEPDSLLITANVLQPTCTTEGHIILDVLGGIAPYTYQWSNGALTKDIFGIDANIILTVTVTDANGCTASETYVMIEPPVMDVLIEVADSLLCYGDTFGVICAIVDGVPPPHFYSWSTGETTECIGNLSAGIYSVTVADGFGCSAYENEFVLTEPAPLTGNITVTRQVTCHEGNDGEATVTASGGTPPYSFIWSNGNTGNVAVSLSAGPVSVTITDANGCTGTATATVNEPAPFDLSSASIITEVTCDTFSDGSITVIVLGGTPPYEYLWDDSTTDQTRDNLAIGGYAITVTDANGCIGTDTLFVTGPPCNRPPVAVDDTASLSICIDESIDIPVLLNDFDPDGDNLFVAAILGYPMNGTVRVNSDQTITYVPNSSWIGVDTFYYLVCDDKMPPLCDTAMVIVAVLPCRPNIFIPNGFSPNGDGVNDNFEIPGIEFFPNNELKIFNRWGNLIREFRGYANEWRGTNASEEPLPDGTYYYILKLNDDVNTTYTGYVVVHR